MVGSLNTELLSSWFVKDLDLQLPELPSFTFGPLDDTEALDASSVSSVVESPEAEQEVEEDLWAFGAHVNRDSAAARLRSWNQFYDRTFQESRNVFISEQGPQVYDSILAAQSEKSGRTLKSRAILDCLLHLGLGRESVLYQYNEELHSFYARVDDGRFSGYSLEIFRSLSTAMTQQGNIMRRLQSFISHVRGGERSSATLVAVAGEISAILSTMEGQVVAAATDVHSLLQLRALFEMPGMILKYLSGLITIAGDLRREEELLSKLFEVVKNAEHEPLWIQNTLFQVFVAASKPWLAEIDYWLGFQEEVSIHTHHRRLAFFSESSHSEEVDCSKVVREDENRFDSSGMPDFISDEDARLIVETGRTLQLIRIHQPLHPLAKPSPTSAITSTGLDWQSSWDGIESIVNQAKTYERGLQEAIERFHVEASKGSVIEVQAGSQVILSTDVGAAVSDQEIDWNLQQSIAVIEASLPPIGTDANLSSPFTRSEQLDSGSVSDAQIFSPPISLLPSLSFRPLIATQARLVNHACLQLLFRQHNLRSHFSVLYRYSLLGDGVFASRLSHALLDPNLESAERRKGHYRVGTSGLKLGYRESWPPASSELRLALMGILTDSYSPAGYTQRTNLFRDEMPGGLSFAIRDMSEEELQKCVDPNSINALDFLRLQYQAPPPINAVITASSLMKYDFVFKLLLRAKRMHFVVDQLSRDTRVNNNVQSPRDGISLRFRINSHHFVSAVCAYFYEGVEAHWSDLECRLKGMERSLDRKSQISHDSVSTLRDFHEELLDSLMFTLLLRKRQAEIMKLLEEIFSLILRFANCVRGTSHTSTETDLHELYELFQRKVKVFINVCRGLSERRGQGGTKGTRSGDGSGMQCNASEDGQNTMGHLLLKFEMNNFYAQ